MVTTAFDTPCVEFDVETTSLQWYAGEPFMAQFLADTNRPTRDNVVVCLTEDRQHRGRIQGALDYCADKRVGLRAHNAKFDLHFAKSAGFKLPPDDLWHDSETLVKLADERVTAALKPTHDRIFSSDAADLQKEVAACLNALRADARKLSKATGEEMVWPNFYDVFQWAPELMEDYAASDCLWQRDISGHYQQVVARDPKLQELYELERATMVALFWAEDRGVPIDRAALAGFELELLELFEALDAKLHALAGIDTFNPNSPKQVGEALERRGANIGAMGKTKTGQIKTEKEDLIAVNDALADTMLEFRVIEKMLNTYVRPSLHWTEWPGNKGPRAPYLTGEDRIHADFRTWGARTGRMSCATPNMQNIPRDDLHLRYTWAARPGRKLVTADMDQIEARLLAAYAGEGRFLAAFREGRDVHSQTAQDVNLTDFRRAGGAVESARQRGKTFNYSVMYGAGKTSLRKNFNTDDAGARRMLDLFHQAYPEIEALQNRISYTLAEQGFIRTKYGRKQRRDDVPWDISYKFLNYLLQGTAGDMIKKATVRCHEAGIPIVAVIHDEIVADVPEEDAEEAAVTIREALNDFPEITEHVPLDADAKIVDRWSDAKTKGDAPHFTPNYQEATP